MTQGHMLLALAATVAVAGCGSSSSTPSYCNDVTNLKTSIKALPNTNIVQNGVSALESAFAKVQTNARAVVGSAKSDFAKERSALSGSVQTLSTTVTQAVASPSVAALTQLPGQVSAVVTAAKNFESAAASKCS